MTTVDEAINKCEEASHDCEYWGEVAELLKTYRQNLEDAIKQREDVIRQLKHELEMANMSLYFWRDRWKR